MIDQTINDIVDEVSLEGNEGCTFDQLFVFVKSLFTKALKDTSLNAPILFDDNYKSYLWMHLRNMEQLIFTLDNVVIDPSKFSYQEMKDKASQGELVIRATEESQDASIYGSLKGEKKNLAENQRLLLGMIAKSRSQGIGQFHLAEKLNTDSKGVFYYLKKLDTLGLIVKESAYTDKMNTRIVFLKRFSKQDQDTEIDINGDYYRVGNFKDNLLKQLSSAKDNMMTLQDAIKAMGFVTHRNIRWARVRIAELHEQGVVEKFNAYDGRRAKPSVRIRNTTEDIAMKEKEDVHSDHAIDSKRQELFYRDLSGDYQFFQDIVASGEKGLVRQDLIDKYPHIDPVIFKTFLENAISAPKSQDYAKYAVYRAEELGGKIRLFRYFDCEGWKKFNEKMGKTGSESKITSKTKAPILEEPKSINQIGKSFGILPKTKIPIKRLLAKNGNATDDSDEDRPKSKKNKATPVSALEKEDDQLKIIQSDPKRVTRTSKSNTSIISTKDQTSANKRKSDSLEDREKDLSSSKTQKETPAPPEIIVFENFSESQPKKAKRGSKASLLNSTKVRRCQILLEMVDKQHIRELNTDIVNEFNEIEKAATGGQKMAPSTFNKMAKQLHEEKKLKLFVTSIQKQFGLNEIKTFLLHTSLSEDSEQVKQFLETYKTERPIMQSKAKRKTLKKVKVQKIPSIEETTEEASKDDKVGPMDSSSYAFQYGWVKSKWHRSRELHESLMDYYVFSKASDHIIDMKEYIKFVSLHTLITIVSNMPYEDEEFRKFVDVEENRKQSLGDVPESIRLLVFQSRLRIRLMINRFLKVLVALDLVKAIEEKDNDYIHAIAPKYFLNEEGSIKDYAFKDRAIVKTLPLRNVEDVRYFWEELQSNCVHPLRYRTEQDEKELQEWADESDHLYHIHRSRGWVVEVVLTAKQKEILDSFIDENSPVIPSDNAPLRTHLARITKLTPKRIRAYYTGVMRALLKKQNKEEKTKIMLQKRLAMPIDSTIDDLMLASKEKRKVNTAMKDLKQQSPFVLSTYIGSRRVRRLRVRTEPYNEKVTSGRETSSTKFLAPDSLENDLLLYAYCIMKTRAKVGQFFWDPITKLLTDKNKHQCRRAFNIMKKRDPGLLITIERLMYKWERYYKEGIQAKKICDENPWDTLEFDLPAFVEYFIIRLQEEESVIINPLHTLPSNTNALFSTYTVIRDAPLVLQAKKEEHQHSVTVSIFDEDTYDTRPEILHSSDDAREIDLVKTLIKMLLITPDDMYNSEAAFSIFSQYTHKVIEDAISSLKDEGLIVRDKSSYGRIPGRKFNVSEKFLKISEGALPHGLVDEARLHYTNVASSKTVGLKIALSGGMVASTLALMSQDKISIFPVSNRVYKKLRDSFYYPKASAVSLRKAFVYKDLEISLKRNVPIYPIIKMSTTQDINAKITIPAPDQIETCMQGMMDITPLANTVYNAVKSSAMNGVSLYGIIHHVKDVEHKEIDIQQITKTVYRLMKHDPPLVQVVGFEQLRYIATEFMSSWLLKTDVDKNFIKPLMWNDVTGSAIKIALDGCSNAVISHILTKPGISHVNLRKKFEKFFTEYELYTLIKYLEESNIVIIRKIQRSSRPKRISIFDKRPLLCTSSNNASLINANEVTCYWISSDYYL